MEMEFQLKCIYSSCSCNKTPNSIDWRNKICYAACNAVHIYSYSNIDGGRHLQTLLGHKKLVTSVHWLKKSNNDPEDELVSTSADFSAIIWKLKDSQFELSSTLNGHTNVVRNAAGVYYSTNNNSYLMLATLSIDSTVRIWLRENDGEVLCMQTLNLGNGFALDAKLVHLSDSDGLVLVLAQDDSHIHFYIQDLEKKFVHAVKVIGHEDWIQSIDVIERSPHNFLLASGSQDCYIRIWEIALKDDSSQEKSTSLKVDATTFKTVSGKTFSVTLESVLSGHENWIYSVQWHQQMMENGEKSLELLSSSMDKSAIIWECESNIWLEKVRVGEVGGSNLGFYGATFSPDAKTMLAHGHHGAIYVWHLDEDEKRWKTGLAFGGHHAPVLDIDWDPQGEYVLSCSLDQTTRLHASYASGAPEAAWFEIGRPQIHGYDMICLSILNRFKYVSAGDEKVLRVFDAPKNFADTLKHLCKLDTSTYVKNNLAEGASVPSLGLSNRAVYEGDIKHNVEDKTGESKHPKDKYPEFYYTPTLLKEPPPEDTLLQNTLWPETQKLYGHPYEVYTVTVNNAKTLVASACKASKPEHAGIILWNSSTWKQVAFLAFHTLTITQMEFSPDDQYLLSVSRDRMWAVYKYFPEESPPYRVVANLDKKSNVHSRIIWSCSWSFDSLYFATASRDKKVAVWGSDMSSEKTSESFVLCCKTLDVDDSATAVSFAPSLVYNKYLVAIGLENGVINLSLWCREDGWNIIQTLSQAMAHHLTVNRLKFSPSCGEAGQQKKNPNVYQLSSCSNDHHVKVFNISTL